MFTICNVLFYVKTQVYTWYRSFRSRELPLAFLVGKVTGNKLCQLLFV